MTRTAWKGFLSFGLVNVPVGLYPATQDRTILFHQFEEGTADRIRLRKVNERTGDEVPTDHIVNGYDLGNGESVIVEPAELDAIAPDSSRILEITDFVDLDFVDPVYFRATYYLAPIDRGALKAYRLLTAAMEQCGRAGIASIVMSGREYLCAVRAHDGVLVLETLFFEDEVRPPEHMLAEVRGVEDAEVLSGPAPKGRELSMAVQLVESMAADWDPGRYHDTYRIEVENLIESKCQSGAVVTTESADEPAPVVDLMAVLEASVREAGTAAHGHPGAGDGVPSEAKRSVFDKRTSTPGGRGRSKAS
jgi:DNA end-binding protein Ku